MSTQNGKPLSTYANNLSQRTYLGNYCGKSVTHEKFKITKEQLIQLVNSSNENKTKTNNEQGQLKNTLSIRITQNIEFAKRNTSN